MFGWAMSKCYRMGYFLTPFCHKFINPLQGNWLTFSFRFLFIIPNLSSVETLLLRDLNVTLSAEGFQIALVVVTAFSVSAADARADVIHFKVSL